MPDATHSTVLMIRRAFPLGVPDSVVLPLARALYDHMSDHQLAAALSQFVEDEPAVVLNTVYKAAGMRWDDPAVQHVVSVLRAHGYADWCDE